ncbi:MAG: hypothetical protein RLY31_1830 [Bacteroidota bacterium]|jgi:threonine synthase
MLLCSTKDKARRVTLEEAVFKGLPEDNGLYMPVQLPTLPIGFLDDLPKQTFQESALIVAKTLLAGTVPDSAVREIVEKAVNFPAPLASLTEDTHVLELFHGPSLAFKDFGARFMAGLMAYFLRGADSELDILVATSGDTGGAVAAGFHNTPGIRVTILYPSGKVSPLQEKQLTTLGGNIRALEIDGTFDDCQHLVKQAFLDKTLQRSLSLSSANSINISRLIPQSFYYFEAYKQLSDKQRPLVFSVPSGNFGNLTAGLIAWRMGLPIRKMIAATNANDIFPHYLASGRFEPKPSVATLSNAMDVGNPSNFARIMDLYGSTWNNVKEDIQGFAFQDNQIRQAVLDIHNLYEYIMDPHGAVGFLALQAYLQDQPAHQGIILETAHPAKFLESMEEILGDQIAVPERLAKLAHLPKSSVRLGKQFEDFKSWLLENRDSQ